MTIVEQYAQYICYIPCGQKPTSASMAHSLLSFFVETAEKGNNSLMTMLKFKMQSDSKHTMRYTQSYSRDIKDIEPIDLLSLAKMIGTLINIQA